MIQSSLRQFGLALRNLDPGSSYSVYHYWRPQMQLPFIVWAEEGEADGFHSDNRKSEVLMDVSIDVYTKTEFDTMLDKVFEFLNDSSIPFSIESVEFEEDTRVIHYTFSCEMVVKR